MVILPVVRIPTITDELICRELHPHDPAHFRNPVGFHIIHFVGGRLLKSVLGCAKGPIVIKDKDIFLDMWI